MKHTTFFTIDCQSGFLAQVAKKPTLIQEKQEGYVYVPLWLIPNGANSTHAFLHARQWLHVHFPLAQFDDRKLLSTLHEGDTVRLQIAQLGLAKIAPFWHCPDGMIVDVVALAQHVQRISSSTAIRCAK